MSYSLVFFVFKGLEIRSIRCPLNSCIVPMELGQLAPDIVIVYSDRRGIERTLAPVVAARRTDSLFIGTTYKSKVA